MSFEVDDEILQDFLVEAGEIIDLLQEQLVDLENNPEDKELLNAIFRGFHTVKGGAGFLSLEPMVQVCHQAENTFDLLRNGKRAVTAELMDIILQAIDAVNAMYEQTKVGETQTPATDELLDKLKLLASGAPLGSEVSSNEHTAQKQPTINKEIDDTYHKQDSIAQTPLSQTTENTEDACAHSSESNQLPDDISEDEFESLLDELHGDGAFSPDIDGSEYALDTDKNDQIAPDNDDISEDEFDNLLDKLHGQGKGPSADNSINNSNIDSIKPTENSRSQQISSTPAKKAEITNQASIIESSTAPITKKMPDKAKIGTNDKGTKITPAETTVRVDTARLDQIMNMVGELVLVRNRLLSLGIAIEDDELNKALSNLDLVTSDLQGAVMKTRMQPIKKVFGRFPRVVRDLARSLHKEIELVLIGEDTDLDKNLVEALADPLVHLVRNSIDHGIEIPEIRTNNGKSSSGTITLSASQDGDHILLKIEDDGAGMDPEDLKAIALNKGVIDEDQARKMTDAEAYNLIFAPGFSTKSEISDISGRGVGMDVVKTRISELNGTVNVGSSLGTGTIVEIKVPLTLAIMPTLMVTVADQVFALPLSNVNEIFNLDLSKTNILDGQLTMVIREKAIPLFYLKKWLCPEIPFDQQDNQFGHVVILQIASMTIGFVVDSLIGQEEVVIKPLSKIIKGTPGMSGATITSDGGIALILDIPNLLKYYVKK